MRNYALQSKVQALQRELDASKKIIEDLRRQTKAMLFISMILVSQIPLFLQRQRQNFIQERPEFMENLGTCWSYQNIQICNMLGANSPRHKFLRRTSLASPNHKIVAVLKEEEGLDETVDDPNALKRPRFSLKEAHELLCDLKDLSTLSLLRDSTEIFEKHYVYPTHQNHCEDGFESSSMDLTCLLRPCILMKVFTYLGIDDLRSMACTEKNGPLDIVPCFMGKAGGGS